MLNVTRPEKACPRLPGRSPRRIFAAFAVCALLPALLALATPARADDLQEASQLLRAGQHQQALEKVNRVLASKPRDAQARFLRGLILTEQGNTREAIAIFQKLTEDFPDLPEPYNNLAVIFAAQGQYDKARSSLEQSIRTHPSYATAYENLGDVYAKLASQAYDKALQLDSSNSAAQNKLALVHELVGGAPRGGAGARSAASKPGPVAAAAAETRPPAGGPGLKPGPAPAATVTAPAAATPTTAPAAVAPAAATAAATAAAAATALAAERAAAKPAAKPAAGGLDALQTVNAWAGAWSKQDVAAYLGFYAKDFKTPNGEARGEWEESRRVRLLGPKSIAVSIDAARVNMASANQASVTFRQRYKSDTLAANSTKTLTLVKTDGRWLIQQEQVAN